MTKIAELPNKENQNKLLWQTLMKLARELQPHFQDRLVVYNSAAEPSFEMLFQETHYYISAGKRSNKIVAVLPGFPGPKGFFGRKQTDERKIIAYHNVANEVLPVVRKTLSEYGDAVHATEIVLQKSS